MSKTNSTIVIFNEKKHIGGMQQLVDSVSTALGLTGIPFFLHSHSNFFNSLRFISSVRKQSVFWAFYGELSPLFIFISFIQGNRNYFLSYGPIVDPKENGSYRVVLKIKKHIRNSLLIFNHLLFLVFSHKILHISQYERTLLFSTWPYSLFKKPGKVIYPVPTINKEKGESKQKAKRHFGFAPNSKILITIGRLERRKNIEDAILVIYFLKKFGFEHVQLVYLFPNSHYSDFEYIRELSALIDEHHLGAQIKLMSAFTPKEVSELYLAADAFLMTSKRFESFGFVTLESLKKDCPVFAYSTCATPEIITVGAPHFLSKRSNPKDLAKLIGSYFRMNESDRSRLKKEVKENADNFSLEFMSVELNRFVGAYE